MDLAKKDVSYDVLLAGLRFPEGPCFDKVGNLWFVEIEGGCLSKWDGRKLNRYDINGTPNGAVVDSKGFVWFCDSQRGEIRKFNPLDESIETVCSRLSDGTRLQKPNDLIFDKKGNLLFSDHADGREEPISTVCVLPIGQYTADVISDNKYFTNGLAFMKYGNKLIFSETYRQTLWIGDWDVERCILNNEKVFAKAGKGPWGPDGIAFDSEEHLYATIFNEHTIAVYNKKGDKLKELVCEGGRPTSCAFDPSGLLGLVVTEAERGELLSFKSEGKGLPIYY
jgi:gluconolactonase